MSDSVENARKFLESLQRTDLAKLLSHSEVESGIGDAGGGWYETYVIVTSPRPFSEAIGALPPHDRKRIAEAVVSDEGDVTAPSDITVRTMPGEAVEGAQALLPELIIQQETMIDCSTGRAAIQDVNDYYMARQARLADLCAAAGIQYENPHVDLWAWFRYYKEHFGSYAERRHYIREMFRSAIRAAAGRTFAVVHEREPTGWERVDRALTRTRSSFDVAAAEEDFQGIGLLCREVLISLGQAVYIEGVHESVDGVNPSPTDAKRMLDAYIRHELPGEGYKEVRTHARAAVDLAVHLQHRRTATRQLAALCLEATSSAVAVVAIISGRGV